jgi:sarcosine oxidase
LSWVRHRGSQLFTALPTSWWTGPGHESVVVGLGAAHGFKFTPTFGRLLAGMACGDRHTVSPTFSLRRPAVTEPDYTPHWLV